MGKTKNNWEIYVEDIRPYYHIQITDHGIPLDKIIYIYLDILSFILTNYHWAAVSHHYWDFYSEKVKKITQESDIFKDIQVHLTNKYDSDVVPGHKDEHHYYHYWGIADITWIKKIIGYGGFNLPHIIYLYKNTKRSWFRKILSNNHEFIKYFYQMEDITLLKDIADENDRIILYGEDGHFCMLIEKQNWKSIYNHIQCIADLLDREVKIIRVN